MKFAYSPRILAQLGTELITSDEVAFTNLFKNSYDAKATPVHVYFLESINKLDVGNLLAPLADKTLDSIKKLAGESPLTVIEDNSNGMDYQQLQEFFLKVGSDLKEQQKKARGA